MSRTRKRRFWRPSMKQVLKWLKMPTEFLLDSFEDDTLPCIRSDKRPPVFWQAGSLHDLVHQLVNDVSIVHGVKTSFGFLSFIENRVQRRQGFFVSNQFLVFRRRWFLRQEVIEVSAQCTPRIIFSNVSLEYPGANCCRFDSAA